MSVSASAQLPDLNDITALCLSALNGESREYLCAELSRLSVGEFVHDPRLPEMAVEAS
jgi:hypothetical protein